MVPRSLAPAWHCTKYGITPRDAATELAGARGAPGTAPAAGAVVVVPRPATRRHRAERGRRVALASARDGPGAGESIPRARRERTRRETRRRE